MSAGPRPAHQHGEEGGGDHQHEREDREHGVANRTHVIDLRQCVTHRLGQAQILLVESGADVVEQNLAAVVERLIGSSALEEGIGEAGPPALCRPLDGVEVGEQIGVVVEQILDPAGRLLLGLHAVAIRVEERSVPGECVSAHPGLLVDQRGLQLVGGRAGGHQALRETVRHPGIRRERCGTGRGADDDEQRHDRQDQIEPALHGQFAAAAGRRSLRRHLRDHCT